MTSGKLRLECEITVAVFWNITTCGLVGIYCHSGATYCLFLLNTRDSRFPQNDDLYHITGCHIPEHSIVQSPVSEPNILHTHIQGAPKTPDGFAKKITFSGKVAKILLTLAGQSMSIRIHLNHYCLNMTLHR